MTVIYPPTQQNIEICAALIRDGELVAFPTETVYGLGANALNATAVKKIYEAKGRPSDNPLIVHVASPDLVGSLAQTIPEKAQIVLHEFMPGPVTIVLKKLPIIPDIVTGGLDTVAIRIPDNALAQQLLAAARCPVCAPSANTSTRPSPTSAAHVYHDLNGKIPAILDGGECTVGVESTVIDFTTPTPRLLRTGGMPVERIESRIGKIEREVIASRPLCPGMKYKHYAPEAEVYLAELGQDMIERICRAYDALADSGKRVAIVATAATAPRLSGREVWDCGETPKDYAKNLFALLRKADETHLDAVIFEGVIPTEYGASVHNRLTKASGGKTI